MKKIFSILSNSLIAIAGMVILHGCYPNDDALSYSETDITLTGYYDSVDFTKLKTYYLPDTVFPVRDDTTDKSPVPNSDLILSEIEKNMTNYGYTRVYFDDEVEEPDLMVAVAAISVTTVTVGWWYPYYPGWGWGWGWGWYKSSERDTDYWYGYPGYYPPGWGWGGVPYYSSYTTGTLLMEMSNPEDYRVVDGDTVVPMYWAGAVSGVLSGGDNTSRISGGIDQAFIQSPYLQTN
jgi:hypothetical protein